MTSLARAGIKVFVLLLAAAALLSLALTAVLRSGRFKDWLLAEVSQRSGFAVGADSLGFRPPLTFIVNAAEVSKAGQFHFTAVRLSAGFSLWSRTVDKLRIDRPTLSLDIDSVMKSTTTGATPIALRDVIVQDGSLTLKKGAQSILDLARITLRAQGFNLGGPAGITLSADVPQLKGTAELTVTGQARDFDAQIILHPKPSGGLFDQRKPATKTELLHLRLKLRAPEGEPVDARMESKFNGLQWAGNKLTGSLSGEASIDAELTSATFTGKVTAEDFPTSFRAMPVKLADGPLNASFTGSYSFSRRMLALQSVRVSAPFGNAMGVARVDFGSEPIISSAKLTLRDIPLAILKMNLPAPWSQWSYDGLGRVSIEAQGPWRAMAVRGAVQCDTLRLRGGAIAAANIAFSVPFEWTAPSWRFKQARLHATQVVYKAPNRWQAAVAKLQVESSLDYQANQPVKISGHMESTGAKFNSPDSSKIGENIGLQGPFEFTADRQMQTATVAAKLTVASGEILWGKFFGDLKSQLPVLDFDADYLPSEDRLRCRRCNFSFANLGLIDVAGAVEGDSQAPVLRLQLSSQNFSSGGFFEFFLRETFNRQYPLLDQLAVAGQLAFQLQVDGPLDALNAAGALSLQGGELRAKSNQWQIGPINLKLPLQIHLAQSRATARGAPPAGTLAIASIGFAGQTAAPIATTLSLANNALRVHQPIRLGLFGGVLVIDNLFWPDALHEPKRLSFSAEAKGLKLEELTQAMQWPRFSGTLTGSIPEVQSADNLLSTRGEIQAELFGGRIRISKLEIENPFSSLASLKLDARIAGIQLEQLTKTFAFGRISGILEGSIDNLVLTHGQPSELSADLHSADRGGEQRISVEALNKITVLSSGKDAGSLYGGLAVFFDSFRYSKLGFKATLKNDRLTLRGVESRNNQELLVVGSFLPPTVNVVSHTQNIAFSELLRRLQQINKTGKPNVQ